jgi:hypothetical protein
MVMDLLPECKNVLTRRSRHRKVLLLLSFGPQAVRRLITGPSTTPGVPLKSIVPSRVRLRPLVAVMMISATAFAALVPPSVADTAVTPGNRGQVLQLVAASSTIKTLPSDLTPSLEDVSSDFASPVLYNAGCEPTESQTSVPACDFGDVSSAHTIVLYGDSHAEMWFDAFDEIATQIGWKLVVLAKPYCPPTDVTFSSPISSGPYTQCAQWQRFAVARIHALHPAVVVITGEFEDSVVTSKSQAGNGPEQWQTGEEETLAQLKMAGSDDVVLGNIADLKTSGPTCLARHPADVQECALSLVKANSYWSLYYAAEQAAARAEGARYINVLPWLCATICSPVIGNFDVYFNEFHITSTYATYLSQVLHGALEPAIKASA